MPRHSRIQHKRHPPLITGCYYFLSSPSAIARHRQKRIQEMKRSRDIKLFPRRGNIYHVKRNISSFTAQFYCSPSVHREQYLNLSSHLAQEIPKKKLKIYSIISQIITVPRFRHRRKARATWEDNEVAAVKQRRRSYLVELLERLSAARHPSTHGLRCHGDEPRRPPHGHLLRLNRPRNRAPHLARRRHGHHRPPPLQRLLPPAPCPRMLLKLQLLLPRLLLPPHRRRELRGRRRRRAALAVVEGRGPAADTAHGAGCNCNGARGVEGSCLSGSAQPAPPPPGRERHATSGSCG